MYQPEPPHAEFVDDDRIEVREAFSDRLGSFWWTFFCGGFWLQAWG